MTSLDPASRSDYVDGMALEIVIYTPGGPSRGDEDPESLIYFVDLWYEYREFQVGQCRVMESNWSGRGIHCGSEVTSGSTSYTEMGDSDGAMDGCGNRELDREYWCLEARLDWNERTSASFKMRGIGIVHDENLPSKFAGFNVLMPHGSCCPIVKA